MQPEVSIVVPLYNEAESFPHLTKRLKDILPELPFSAEIVMIDDGSTDNTANLMRELSVDDPSFQSIFLSRNYGHQLALSAGLNYCRGTEAVMVIDGDLQDPPELLKQFYSKLKEGYDVVYAVRKKRKESFLKKLCYKVYYRIMRRMANIEIPLDSGDFGLISRRVVNVLNSMPEESRYIRGMRSWVGFKQAGIEYEREERVAGESKYSLSKLFQLAYNGIFNFSEIPVKFITNLGFISIAIALMYLVITLVKKFFFNGVPEGFTALIFSIVLFSGVQLIALGIIGEYVVRIFFQVKNRPLFVIKGKIQDGKETNE